MSQRAWVFSGNFLHPPPPPPGYCDPVTSLFVDDLGRDVCMHRLMHLYYYYFRISRCVLPPQKHPLHESKCQFHHANENQPSCAASVVSLTAFGFMFPTHSCPKPFSTSRSSSIMRLMNVFLVVLFHSEALFKSGRGSSPLTARAH